MKNKSKLSFVIISFISILFIGWGSVGHRIISGRTILTVTPQMTFWGTWSDSLAAHASDADDRKSTDPNEAPKHYIDIDNYPEFVSTGNIPHDYDSIVALHGYSFVIQQGILPWAIMTTMDSLESNFRNNDYHKAMLTAADLGHYIGDMHMPLHLTRNYNGQYSGQTGVHSRYESNMIYTYNGQITYSGDSLIYIDNVADKIFEMINENYTYVDSVLKCDSIAKAFAGNTNSSTYYSKLWELTKAFTIKLFKNASYRLTCFIYTAWVNANNPVHVENENSDNNPSEFSLLQNYPNPFNPATKIKFNIPNVETRHASSLQMVTLKVYDILGNEIATLVNQEQSAGSYEVEFNSTSGSHQLASGVYYCQLKAGSFIQTKKMILLK
jgi:hypothetical protein